MNYLLIKFHLGQALRLLVPFCGVKGCWEKREDLAGYRTKYCMKHLHDRIMVVFNQPFPTVSGEVRDPFRKELN